jgi:hypothetical protein
MKQSYFGHLGYKHVVLYANTIASEECGAMIYTVSKLVRPYSEHTSLQKPQIFVTVNVGVWKP